MRCRRAWRRLLRPVASTLLLYHGARGGYSEADDRCRFTLWPGSAPGAGALEDIPALLKGAFAFTQEFERLPPEEVEAIDRPADRGEDIEGAAKCKPSTFLSLPVEDILRHKDFDVRPNRSPLVLDLGAGFGRPLLEAVLAHGAGEGLGVELSPTRWRKGCAALRQLDHMLARPERRPANRTASVELRLGDALQADVAGASHVLLFGTCFPAPVLEGLQRKLLTELPAGARVACIGDRGVWRDELELELEEADGPLEASHGRRGGGGRRSLSRLQAEAPDDDLRQRFWHLRADDRGEEQAEQQDL